MTRENSGDELDPFESGEAEAVWLHDQYDEAWQVFIASEVWYSEQFTANTKEVKHDQRRKQFTKYRAGGALGKPTKAWPNT